jgi:CRISPR-associated protein Cas2
MSKRFVVVTYDIPNDRRRVRLHQLLGNYGTPVQYSVFECLVDEDELMRMRRDIQRVIKPRLDDVRFYFLCANCQAQIETTAAGENIVQEQDGYIV